MFPVNHKIVFVLDHSSAFAQSCRQSVEYDVLSKTKTPGIIPAAPIYKTMWTCSVESMMEYMRLVYDLFPADKLIRVVTGSQSLTTWAQSDQNLAAAMQALSSIRPPEEDEDKDDYDVVHGLTQAVEVLCQPSEGQAQVLDSGEEEEFVSNRGRIICITNMKSEAQIRMLEECVNDALEQHNNLATETDGLLPINQCELVLLHTVPVGDTSRISDRPVKDVSSLLSSEVVITQSGKFIYNTMVDMVYNHYGLSSTTVTGIPMKEEQNASSSANYDVELLHLSDAHEELLSSSVQAEGLVIASKEGLPIKTVTLKWCTPKSNITDLPACTGAYRITPVDVNSRPSSCLTNFLLSGRAVMLEQPKKTGAKVISHMLASHGGEIFIHSIPTARSILEDPPSISEGLGGRVTDYRIPDFREFMKDNRLAPASPNMKDRDVLPLDRAKKYLERTSRNWPMVISDTIIFNMASHIDPLPSLLVKEKLEEDDLLECKKAIYHVVGMETRNDPLPVVSSGARGKGPKRDEQYRQMWSELETLIRSHADTSPMHYKILECLLECKKPSEDLKSPSRVGDKSGKDEKMDASEVDKSWKDLDKFQKMTEREKLEYNKSDMKDEDAPATKKSRTGLDEPFVRTGGGQNLMSLWTNRIKAVHAKRHVQFAGRAESEGNIAPLYIHLNEDEPRSEVPTDGNTGNKR